MNRRLFRITVPGLLFLIGLVAGCQKEDASKLGTQDEELFTGEPTTVVATVGDSEILLREVDQVTQLMRSAGMPNTGELSPREMQRQALDNLVERELLLTASRNAGQFPSDEQVERASQSLRASFPTPLS